MAARRCSVHGISYPDNYTSFHKCPVCIVAGLEDTHTSLIGNETPDEDWDEQAKRLILEIKNDQEVSDLIPSIEAKVSMREGRYFISSHDIIRSDVRHRLGLHDLVRVGKQVFEIQAYSDSLREYWVAPFSMTLSDADLRRLADG